MENCKISRRSFMQAAALGSMSVAVVGGSVGAQAASESVSTAQTVVVEGFDWGPAVTELHPKS